MYEATQQTTSIKPSKPTPKDLLDLIRQHVQSFRETFIFVDAINESENPLEIVEMLGRLLDHSGQRSVRVFISSINEKGIEKAVQFRWVQCQLDLLSKVRTPSALSEALASLPTTLAATYESLLLQIDGEEDQRLAREILQVLAFSLRPVTLLEISEYLQVTTSLPYQDRSKQLLDPKDVLSICGSLLNFDPDTGVVALAHHSVLTYLTSELQGDVRRFYLGEREGHSALAKKCLAYLSFDEFAHQSPWMHPRLETFPFLDYAGTFWAQHASRLDSLDDELWAVMKTFLRSNELGRTNFMAWVRQLLPHASWKSIQDTPPLYYAASYGLTIVAEYLLDVGADIEGRGGRSSATPLNIASFRRQVPMVKLLLARGANPRYPDAEGLSAIDWAKARGYTEILSLLRSAK
ncbi:MAG: hypothetical protein M1837_002906 [Sclerophora amabilis]|nr:MAG: hypothetical protein M1837_002906 [Sclerophora amabilis]